MELPTMSLISTAASTAFGAYSSYQSGQQQQAASNYNAQVASNNAAIASQVGESNAQQAALQGRIQAGKMQAALAASGVDASSGTPMMLLSNQAEQSSLNQQNAMFQGANQATSYNNQAAIDRYQGSIAEGAGDSRAISGLLTGTTSGVGNYYRMTGMNSTVTNPFSMGGV